MRISVNGISFTGIGSLKEYLREILNFYNFNQEISQEHLDFIIFCMKLTPHGIKKIGSGISKITVVRNYQDSKMFTLFREDGSHDDFSYKKILPNTDRKTHSNHEKDVIQAFRESVTPKPKTKGNHIHHENILFSEIYSKFIKENKLDSETIELIEPHHGIKEIKNQELKKAFTTYHDDRAVLIELTPAEHLLKHCPNHRGD